MVLVVLLVVVNVTVLLYLEVSLEVVQVILLILNIL